MTPFNVSLVSFFSIIELIEPCDKYINKSIVDITLFLYKNIVHIQILIKQKKRHKILIDHLKHFYYNSFNIFISLIYF